MSPKYTLNSKDAKKIASALLFSVASAALAFTIGVVQEIDFAEYAFIVPFINVVLYSASKWLEGR